MNFSEGYLTENFEKALNDGLKAKDRGNLALAKERFFQASKILNELALISEGTVKEERLQRAEKLKKISDSIKVENSPPKTDYGQTYGAEGDEKDVSGFITTLRADELTFGFEGVVGLDEAKNAITEYVINPLKYPDAYNYDFKDGNAVLLYGPPGTGKTTFAKAVAKEAGQPFFMVNTAEIVNCYVGETAKNIVKVFDYLRTFTQRNGGSAIVFFDEFDEISKKRGGDDKTSETAVPSLLRNLDGVKRNKGLTVIANTNCKDMLDSAILSRFRRHVFIPLPDKESRCEMFKYNLKELEKEYFDKLDFESFSEKSEGLSGRDIAYLCDDLKRVVSKYKAGLTNAIDLNGSMTDSIISKLKGERNGQ